MSVGHIHNPVQHRDGKPPWCHECGLTADYQEPVSKLLPELDEHTIESIQLPYSPLHDPSFLPDEQRRRALALAMALDSDPNLLRGKDIVDKARIFERFIERGI